MKWIRAFLTSKRATAYTRRALTVVLAVLLALKLTGTVAWSWWVVFAPMWGPLAVVAVLLAVVALARAADRMRGIRA